MVAVPARPEPLFATRWILPVVVIVGTWIGMLWLLRPQWGFCADGIDAAHSFCDSGVFSLGAQLGTVGLLVLLAVYVALVFTVRGRRRRIVLMISLVVLAIACLAAAILLFQPLEQIPIKLP